MAQELTFEQKGDVPGLTAQFSESLVAAAEETFGGLDLNKFAVRYGTGSKTFLRLYDTEGLQDLFPEEVELDGSKIIYIRREGEVKAYLVGKVVEKKTKERRDTLIRRLYARLKRPVAAEPEQTRYLLAEVPDSIKVGDLLPADNRLEKDGQVIYVVPGNPDFKDTKMIEIGMLGNIARTNAPLAAAVGYIAKGS